MSERRCQGIWSRSLTLAARLPRAYHSLKPWIVLSMAPSTGSPDSPRIA
jgi:hypothetical protein